MAVVWVGLIGAVDKLMVKAGRLMMKDVECLVHGFFW